MANPLSNPSFEEAGANPGEAAWWTQDVSATAEDAAPFLRSDGYTRPWDDFENSWGIYPYNNEAQAAFEASDLVRAMYEGQAYGIEGFEYSWREPVTTGPVAYNHQSNYGFDLANYSVAMFDTATESGEDFEEYWGLSPYNDEAIWTFGAGLFTQASFDPVPDTKEDFENFWGIDPENHSSEYTFDPGNFTPCGFDAPPMDYEDFEHGWTESIPE